MSRLGAGVGAGLGAVVGTIAGVAAAAAIEGSLEKASRTNEDSLMGLLGMFFGGVTGAAIGAGSCETPKPTGTVSGPPRSLRFP